MPLTAEEARQQAQAEGLTLRVAENTAGYFGVHHQAGKPKPYQAKVKRSGKQARKGETYLGSFATAEEAALCIARWLAVAELPRYVFLPRGPCLPPALLTTCA